ncbi:MAG: ABC-F family ATP-binding cassette domain-containing protein [Firmicutes bacterium]|nr:ABC-F family ATP-binding cassette domain-containing protein [Bacillota bacterium]
MTDISVHNLVKAFEVNKNILDGLSFEITAGERVCLLGKNGAGKTTLFRLLTGELAEDEGDIVIAPGRRVGLISQIPVYPAEYTTEDVLKTAHRRVFELAARIDALTARMARDSSPAVLEEYGRLQHEFERLGGWDTDFERDKVANGLDIPQKMREQLFSSLSGGEQTRVNLARLILEDTDILLLDEPTNHLDLRATEWLEDYLLRFKGTVLAISHDRWFLDKVAQRTIELVGGKAVFYSGNYSFYVVEKQRRHAEQLTRYEREQKELKRLDEAAWRLYQWGTGNERLMKKSKAIRTRMERVKKTDRPETDRRLRAKFGEREFSGDEALYLEGLSKSYGGRKLFDIPELLMEGGERIALIGDNGAGKSTLLKLILGEEEPDTGYVRLGPSVKTAYLPQLVGFSNEQLSVLDTVLYELNVSPQTARNMLGAFQFSGEDVFKPVWALSGGEKSRLRLCILMRENINLLILDEPTNHLDLQSREWIEGALLDYAEALLFVSHDRYFIDRFATRIWNLENGVLEDFPGGFAAYRAARERETQLSQRLKNDTRRFKNDASQGENSKKPQETPGNLIKQRERAEREIEKLEARQKALLAEAEENASDYQKLLLLDAERDALEAELDELYQAWEILL